MTYTLRELLGLKARAEGGTFPLTELFHHPGTNRLSHAALDTGGWLSRHEVLVSLDRFGIPDRQEWPVAMDHEAVEQAPNWDDAPSQSSLLPPIVVGPFGSTFSPLMMNAQLQEMAEDEQMPIRVPEGPDGRILELERASQWFGREAFGPEGRLGVVDDMRVDESYVMTDVILEGEEIPIGRLRRIAEQGHAIFD